MHAGTRCCRHAGPSASDCIPERGRRSLLQVCSCCGRLWLCRHRRLGRRSSHLRHMHRQPPILLPCQGARSPRRRLSQYEDTCVVQSWKWARTRLTLPRPPFRPYGQTEELLESGILRDEGEDEVAAQDQPIAGQQPKRQLVLDKAHAKVIHDRAKFVPLPTFQRTDGTTCIRLSAEPHAAAPCTHW